MLQDDLGAVHVGLDRVHRLLDDQLDADRGRQVDHDVGAVDELGEQRLVLDAVDRVVEAGLPLEVRDVVDRSGRQVVEDEDLVAALEERLAQVRPDESGSAGNQHTHRLQPDPAGDGRRVNEVQDGVGGARRRPGRGRHRRAPEAPPGALRELLAESLIIQDAMQKLPVTSAGSAAAGNGPGVDERRQVVRQSDHQRRDVEHRGIERDGRVDGHDAPRARQQRRQRMPARADPDVSAPPADVPRRRPRSRPGAA